MTHSQKRGFLLKQASWLLILLPESIRYSLFNLRDFHCIHSFHTSLAYEYFLLFSVSHLVKSDIRPLLKVFYFDVQNISSIEWQNDLKNSQRVWLAFVHQINHWFLCFTIRVPICKYQIAIDSNLSSLSMEFGRYFGRNELSRNWLLFCSLSFGRLKRKYSNIFFEICGGGVENLTLILLFELLEMLQ